MLIDWFTVIAQIINFLVLVGFLKFFLFDPILDRVDNRRKEMLEKQENTEKKLNEAEEKKQTYQKKLDEIEKEAKNRLQKADEEAKNEKNRQLKDIRNQIKQKEQVWIEGLEKEKKEHMDQIKKQMELAIFSGIKKILKEFYDTEFQEKMLKNFLQKIEKIKDDEIKNVESLKFFSSFVITNEWKEKMKVTIKKKFGEKKIDFEQDEKVLGGVMIEANSHRIIWNPMNYLDSLEKSFTQ